jgi:hypothetical protein
MLYGVQAPSARSLVLVALFSLGLLRMNIALRSAKDSFSNRLDPKIEFYKETTFFTRRSVQTSALLLLPSKISLGLQKAGRQ